MCERACLVQELREWLEQWVVDRGSQMLKAVKVGLARKVVLTSSVGKVESLKGVRLGSGIEMKGSLPALCSLLQCGLSGVTAWYFTWVPCSKC